VHGAKVRSIDDLGQGFNGCTSLGRRSGRRGGRARIALEDMNLATLAASFVMIGDILTHSGVSEAQLVELAREGADTARADPLGAWRRASVCW
jgi:hypothetical protein